MLLRNEGGNKNNWLRLSLKGLTDNKCAIGTKVEVFAGANRQKFEIYGSSGYLGQNSTDIVVGLGQAKEADVVRMLWPTGVIQDEIQIAGERPQFPRNRPPRQFLSHAFRLGRRHYELVGDMLGAGVVGHWVGPNQRDIPRPTEYIKVARDSVREKNGKLSFRFMEPLEEAVYLDQVKLLAVDHPPLTMFFPTNISPATRRIRRSRFHSRGPSAGGRAGRAWSQSFCLTCGAHRYFGDFRCCRSRVSPSRIRSSLIWASLSRRPAVADDARGDEYFSATSMFAAYQAGIERSRPMWRRRTRAENGSA